MTSRRIRRRLDVLLVERGLAESLQKAQAMILAGEVRVDGARAEKAGESFADSARIEVSSRKQQYASRGGLKLAGALVDFSIDVNDRVCLDVGVSTGGFTDCLLQNGAARVYAVDVNVSQLAWKLHNDPRVIRIERNARELRSQDVPEPVDLVVLDVSFISVGKVLAPAAAAARHGADLLILVKPQFELPREDVGPGGIVVGETLHNKALAIVKEAAATAALEILDARPSRLLGAEGNQEYFLHTRKKSLE
jgi:23S rRNA (cytidine1920-2'-O)/16S rRNA (cytidine1409-2'-O)-methyltransferase